MQHNESSTKIYYTREYERFLMVEGNRPLNMRKINKIKADINDGLDVLKYCPIICNERDGKLHIVDGQHRFSVAKQLGTNVHYVISSGLSLMEIAQMNSRTEKWKASDFINCYVQQGNSNYQLLSDFIAKYNFPLSVCLRLLTYGIVSADGSMDTKNEFQEGKFVVKKYAAACHIGDIILNFTGHKSRPFIVAICKIIESQKVHISVVIEAYKKHSDKLAQCSSWKEYISAIEYMVNAGKKQRVVIY